MRKLLFVLSIIALVCSGPFGCSKDDGEKEGSEAVSEKIKIGLSFSDFEVAHSGATYFLTLALRLILGARNVLTRASVNFQ